MCKYWTVLAQNDGFDGVYFIFRYDDKMKGGDDNYFKYEPLYSGWTAHNLKERIVSKIERNIRGFGKLMVYDYDQIWTNIIRNAEKDSLRNIYHGCFVSYDDTPRRGNRGVFVKNASAEKFAYYLEKLLDISEQQGKEFVFLTAWNEWGEGAFLEPDQINNFNYLKSVEEVISK